jgi:hypothetical protein
LFAKNGGFTHKSWQFFKLLMGKLVLHHFFLGGSLEISEPSDQSQGEIDDVGRLQ